MRKPRKVLAKINSKRKSRSAVASRSPLAKINSKRKGRAYEQRIARFLRDRGWTVQRAQQSDGRPDADVSGTTPAGALVAIECKDRAALSLAGLDRAMRQAEMDVRALYCLVVVHVPGNGREGMDLAVMRLGALEAVLTRTSPIRTMETLPRTIDEAVTKAIGMRRKPRR
jgi:hypothetical protein